VFTGAIHSALYFDKNGLQLNGKILNDYHRYDYYIKPILYGRYWQDELIYFPKYGGTENVTNFNGNSKLREHAVVIKYPEIIQLLKNINGPTTRIYENVPVK
jgi:hypothetical protein